jgi:hypothetical protein
MMNNDERERPLRFTMKQQGYGLERRGARYRVSHVDEVVDGVEERAVDYDDGRLEDVERWWIDGTGYESTGELYDAIRGEVAVVDELIADGWLDMNHQPVFTLEDVRRWNNAVGGR